MINTKYYDRICSTQNIDIGKEKLYISTNLGRSSSVAFAPLSSRQLKVISSE